MSLYSLSVQAISRSQNRSATACAAYRAGARIEDWRTGQVHDYRRKQGVVHSEIALPNGAPEWARDREALWNAAEAAEHRKDSRVAREVRIALPDELSEDDRTRLTMAFAQYLADEYKVAVDAAIHAPHKDREDARNHHAHLMITTRRLEPDGLGEKTKEFDQRKLKAIPHCRERWAEMHNTIMAARGLLDDGTRVDHRSYQEQGIDKVPGRHLGPDAAEMVRREQRAAAERGEEWNPAESQVRLVREPAQEREEGRKEIAAEEARLDSLTPISLRRELDRVSTSSRDETEKLSVLETERRDRIEARAEASDRVKGIAARHAMASRKVEGWHNRHRIQSFFVKWGFMQPKQLTALTDERDDFAIALVDERERRRELSVGVVHAGRSVGAQQEVLRNLQERGHLLETQLELCEAAKDLDQRAERREQEAAELEAQRAVELAGELEAERKAELAAELAAEKERETREAAKLEKEKVRRAAVEAKNAAWEEEEAAKEKVELAAARREAEKLEAPAHELPGHEPEPEPEPEPEAAKPEPEPAPAKQQATSPRARARTLTPRERALERRRRAKLTAERANIRAVFTHDELQSQRLALLVIDNLPERAHAQEIFDGARDGEGLREVLAHLEDRRLRSLVRYAAQTIKASNEALAAKSHARQDLADGNEPGHGPGHGR